MYILKSENDSQSTVKQSELNDFLGIKRTIVFDLDDPIDAKKGRRVLRPKGIRRRRTPNNQKRRKFKQTPLQASLFPNKKGKSVITSTPKSKVKVNLLNTKKKQKTKEVSPNIIPNIQKLVKKQDLTKIIPKTKPITQKKTETKLESKKRITEKPKKTAIKTQIREVTPTIVPKKVLAPQKEKISKKDVTNSSYPEISANFIEKLGYDGDLEIECPFCSDYIQFHHDDVDEKSPNSTRQCACNAILRLSIRKLHPKIFNDLLIPANLNFIKQAQTNTNIQDEYGNYIIVHGFRSKNED